MFLEVVVVAVAVGDRLSRSRDNDDSPSSCVTQFYKLGIESVLAIESKSQSPPQVYPDSGNGKADHNRCFRVRIFKPVLEFPCKCFPYQKIQKATCPGLFNHLWQSVVSNSKERFNLKVPITEFFLFSHLNLYITRRTSAKKFFDLHET